MVKQLVGSEVEQPYQMPARGWWQIAKRVWHEGGEDHVALHAAGVAFWLFLSLFPTLIAVITIYGLVVEPAQAARQVEQVAQALPSGARSTLIEQVSNLTSSAQQSLTFGLIASLAGALWASSTGVMNLIKAVNIAYDEGETRNFIRLRAIALVTTLGMLLFLALSLALVAAVPVVLDTVGLGGIAAVATQVLRWVGLVLLVLFALGLLYRYAPSRESAKVSWVSVGALVATVVWVAASALFSLYVSWFGNYNKTYGALAGAIVLLLWLYITSYIVLLGAEVNAETEHQTARDTTTGAPRPMGERGAYVADTYPEDARPDDLAARHGAQRETG